MKNRILILGLLLLSFLGVSQTATTSGNAIRKEITPKFVNGLIKQYTIAKLRQLRPSVNDSSTVYYSTDAGKEGVWKIKSGSSEADNLGTILACANGVRLSRIFENSEVYPEWFGAVGDGTTNDSQAIQNAIEWCKNSNVSTIALMSKNYLLSSSITLYAGLNIIGQGVDKTTIKYSGSASAIIAERIGEANTLFLANKFKGFTITAISGATTATTANGIRFGNSYGNQFEDVKVQNFGGGHGILCVNSIYWTEGTLFSNVHLRFNKIGIRFTLESVGTDSFCNTRMLHVNIVTTDNQIGIQADSGASVYASTWIVKGNFEGTRSNQTGVKLDNANMYQCFFDIDFEAGDWANTTNTQSRAVWLVNNSSIEGTGNLYAHINYVCTIVDATSNIKLNSSNTNTYCGNFATYHNIKVASLKTTSDLSNNNKVIIEIYGGDWTGTGSSITRYIVSSRGSLTVMENVEMGTKTGFQLKVYQKPDNTYDICILSTQQFVAFNIRAFLIEDFRMSELKLDSQSSSYRYDTTGKTDVTPIFITNTRYVPNTADITATDGTLQIVTGGSIHGKYRVEYTGSNRKHVIYVLAESHQYSSGRISILSEFRFGNAIVFSNFRFQKNTDGSSISLVCDVGNRNSSTNTEKVIVNSETYDTAMTLTFSPTNITPMTNYVGGIGMTADVTLVNGIATITGLQTTSASKCFTQTKTIIGTSAHAYTYDVNTAGTLVITARQANGNVETGCNSVVTYQIIN